MMNTNASITPNKSFGENVVYDIDDWNSINWPVVEDNVSHMQTRIAKAIANSERNKAKRLQHLLVNSYYAKCLAVKKVTTNRGKNTPGVDGVIWSTSEQKLEAVESLKTEGYRAQPLRRVFIPKKNGKKRPLSIPTMQDRAMQALYAFALDPIAEVTADSHSYGFRKGRGARDAAKRIYTVLFQKEAAQWIIEGDIRACFDKINHDWLMGNIPMNSKVLRQFLKAGYVYDKQMFSTNEGTPQGGIISPILANMTLDGIEKLLDENFRNKWVRMRGNSLSKNPHKIHLVRYADDFVITCNSRETAEVILDKLKAFLAERGLELSEEKTKVTHVDEGFDFLGYNFKKTDGVFRIQPSKASIEHLQRELKNTVVKMKAATQENLILALNPKITGWAMYHRNFVASQTFKDMDHYLWSILWKWARGRHTNKGSRWIYRRYWHKGDERDRWMFQDEESTLRLFSDVKIVRHTNLKADMNPYLNPGYFQERYSKKAPAEMRDMLGSSRVR